MTALHKVKQNMKEFYGKFDVFILPVLKFILAFITFQIINSSLGFMDKLSNIFIVLILSVLCSVLPLNIMVFLGFLLALGHCYALGIEIAAFALILMIVLIILFLRFSGGNNAAFILAPVAFQLQIPAVLPIGCGLLSGPSSAVPAGCGVVFYYFMKLVKEQESLLGNPEGELVDKLQVLLDGIIQNQDMWLAIMSVVVVSLIVYIIRKMFLNYSWHIAIAAGVVAYLVIMIAGSSVLEVKVDMVTTVITAIASLVIGFVMEFFVMGVDYSRSQSLQFEDDEYVYYVKAIPKSCAAETAEKKAEEKPKKRETRSRRPEISREKKEEYLDEGMEDEKDELLEQIQEELDMPVEKINVEDIDFEQKLEDSLKEL